MSLPIPATDTQVVVTGTSSGIGTELARGLAARGHNVALVPGGASDWTSSPTNYGLVIGWSSRPMPAIWVMRRNGGR